MVTIYKSFKLFQKSILIFYTFFNLILIVPNFTFAHETYLDAMKWYKDNASDIDAKQNYLIGLKLENKGDVQKAITFFSIAANSGLTEAQIKFGSYLIKSNNPEDHKKARKIFKSLSDKNSAIASFKLGWMYENALGGKKDLYKAEHFYKIAASRNQYNAYLYLANLALIGQNNKNLLLAASYSSIAKSKNVDGADNLLKSILPLLKTDELDEMEILISSLESEVKKIKTN